MVQPLHDVFKQIGKPMTKDNCHQLCAIACAAPEIFFAPAMPPMVWFFSTNIADSYLYTREIPYYEVYGILVRKVVSGYGVAAYTDAAVLKEIFTALDDKIAELRHCLTKDGFPDLTY
jgi:hypothetical protein